MNQINSNLKTLAELCFTGNANWIQGVYNYNEFLAYNTNNGTGQSVIYPSQFLTNLIQNYNSQIANTAYNVYCQIIYLFAHAIPYDQTTQNYTFTIPSSDGSTSSTQTFIIPDVFYQIDAYMTFYQNRILQYITQTTKYINQIKAMNSGYTNTYAYNTKQGTAGQNNAYDVTSFNPVETDTSIGINPVNVTTGNYSASANNAYSVNSGQSVTMNGATYNNHASANASNSSQYATNNALNLQNYASVGQSDGMTILRPLIKKISSLFWSLGNDYYPDNINWGFNIW